MKITLGVVLSLISSLACAEQYGAPISMKHPVSLEAANEAGFFVSVTNTFGGLTFAGAGSDRQTRQRVTLEVVTGLADPACHSFRLPAKPVDRSHLSVPPPSLGTRCGTRVR